MRGQRGFTLLELAIAMSFVALVATGIVLSISTCLNIWEFSSESADLNQEARAVIETLSRDVRNSYLGTFGDRGFFIGFGAAPDAAQFDSLSLTTQGGDISRAALLPDDMRSARQEERPPASDYVGVRYEWRPAEEGAPAGLYRVTWVAPNVISRTPQVPPAGSESAELISRALTRLQLRYYNGLEWAPDYNAPADYPEPPSATSIEITLRDQRGREHEFRTMVSSSNRAWTG